MNFKKGDILRASDRTRNAGYHPIIFIESLRGDDFIGAMLTHGDESTYGNIPMREEHFNPPIGAFTFKYNATYLVKAKFLKPLGWGPYTKCGTLTSLGVEFIDSSLQRVEYTDWETYRAKSVQKRAI